MLAIMVLALAVTAQDFSSRHVRASELRILALIDAGHSRPAASDNPAIVCGGHAGPACGSEPPMMRVRSNGDPAVTTLLHDAVEGSATFRRLVETLNGTDGIVYIEQGSCGRTGFRPCLLMSVTVAGPSRVLHIRIDIRRDSPAVIGSIGHELNMPSKPSARQACGRTHCSIRFSSACQAARPRAAGSNSKQTRPSTRVTPFAGISRRRCEATDSAGDGVCDVTARGVELAGLGAAPGRPLTTIPPNFP